MPSTSKEFQINFKATVGDIGGFFKEKELQSILTRVNQASANLQSLTGKANSIVGKVKIDGILKETAGTIAETKATIIAAKGFVTDLENKLNDMKLPETHDQDQERHYGSAIDN